MQIKRGARECSFPFPDTAGTGISAASELNDRLDRKKMSKTSALLLETISTFLQAAAVVDRFRGSVAAKHVPTYYKGGDMSRY